ncbi:hypothetical protein Goklo_029368, partial [Gossypium klotzschianum]|nr:hypothetical protein [Gossypium klotzschianum]MBA0672398.1 hypothetical protein [Gossypium klotzschianum]
IGIEAFSRIAPAVPIIANVIICENLFEVLTISTGGRLHFSIYEKYLNGLERYGPLPCQFPIRYHASLVFVL